MRVLAPAKVNLFLRVVARRPDGYHELKSRMQKLALYDELTIARAPAGVALSCPGGGLPEGPENLVWRAAALFLTHAPEAGGARITLHKKIPTAAGLGGGSSDAAATLRGLNTLHGSPLDEERLAAWGLELGADVPFFARNMAAADAGGVGEVLRPAPPLPDCVLLLVKPGFAVSTAWAYRNLDLTRLPHKDSLPGSRNAGWAGLNWGNDLEQVTLARHPVLAEIKTAMLEAGAEVALMSGSGPTIFGIFTDRARAEAAQPRFRRRFAESFLVEPLRD